MRTLAIPLAVLALGSAFRAPATVTVEVRANGTARTEKPAEARLNFTQLLSAAGIPGTLDENSLRVEEVTSGGALVDANVPFQFDRDASYNATTNASGTLVFILEGSTAASATRYYRVSFDRTGAGYTPPSVAPQITFTDNVTDEGQASYRIATPVGTYFYHKEGAGFSSLNDPAGNDWIGYHNFGGSDGMYRGIPNLGGRFHPGYTATNGRGTASTSSILSQGPLKLTIRSVTIDSAWECTWEIYPRYARFTLLRKGSANYYFLYEGTPGGQFNGSTDFWTRSNGQRGPASQTQEGDIPAPEWVYWEDSALSRILFLAHHEDDSLTDRYWPMENNMTVFGFGRAGGNDILMTAVPQRFTIGFGESKVFSEAQATIHSATRDLVVTTSSGPPPPPQPPAPPSGLSATAVSSSRIDLAWTDNSSDESGFEIDRAPSSSGPWSLIHTTAPNVAAYSNTGLSPSTAYSYRVRATNAAGDSTYSNIAAATTLAGPPPPPPPGDALNYAYYTGSWTALPDFSALTPARTGTVGGFDLSPRTQDDNFGFVFTGYLALPTEGSYTFFTTSDDGSRLLIDGMEVVNNDGLHGAQERSGSLTLAAGEHAIEVAYFEAAGGQSLAVSYEGPGILKQAIPASALSATSCG
jgi:hypothetical protein